MRQTPPTFLSTFLTKVKPSVPLTVGIALALSGCSSMQTPEFLSKLSMPDMRIPANEPSFKRAMYAGGSLGQSRLNPDTSGTVFTTANDSATATQFRVGVDVHNKLSVELDTSVLGKVEFKEAGADVSYSSAAVSALVYGLSNASNRSLREGFNPYARVGYGIVQQGSIVEPFDRSTNKLLFGVGLEYGFVDGLAARADVVRVDSGATLLSLGGIYRFGKPSGSRQPVFVKSGDPAIDAANENMAAGGQNSSPIGALQSFAAKMWYPTTTMLDSDGDGVANDLDQCEETPERTTTNDKGCGLFDALLSEVSFKPGSAWLTPIARGELDSLSKTILAFPEARIQVRAHTDSEGPADQNLGLSALRAESVVAYLVEKGVRELQLETLGLGESQPIDTNETAEGRKRNRRIELLTLANVDESTFEEIEAAAAAALEKKNAESATKHVAASSAPWFGEPVFPPMSGVKIEPLPKSAQLPGLTLGGVLDGIKFEKGLSELTPDSEMELITVSNELDQFPQIKLVVMAHTDNQLGEEESKALSVARANAIVSSLVSLGTDAERLSVEGFGSSLPIAQNVTQADRERNERIELRVIN